MPSWRNRFRTANLAAPFSSRMDSIIANSNLHARKPIDIRVRRASKPLRFDERSLQPLLSPDLAYQTNSPTFR
jgi:hypothetical protein